MGDTRTRNTDISTRKKTVPSIPDYRRGRPVKDLGPGSYSPNDQLVTKNSAITKIHQEKVSLPELACAPETETYLKTKVMQVLKPDENAVDLINS